MGTKSGANQTNWGVCNAPTAAVTRSGMSGAARHPAPPGGGGGVWVTIANVWKRWVIINGVTGR